MSLKKNYIYEFEGFQINLDEKTLWHDNERISLAPKVFETLEVLLVNQGRLMTKDELMNEIWGETFVEERNLTQNIFTLRKEFKKQENETKIIETIPRRGYKFVADVHHVESTHEETSLSIKHKKNLTITAEGSVSKAELTEAVKEITRDIISNEKTDFVKQKRFESKNDRLKLSRLSLAISAGVLATIMFGVVFLAWQNDYFNFLKSKFVGNIDTSKIKFDRLTDSGNVFFPAISSDNQFLAYVENEDSKYSLKLKNIASGSETIIVPPKEYEMRSPQFSKDGSYLFYGARDGKMETTVYKIPIFGGTPNEIITNVNQNFSISPNGEKFAYFRDNPKTGGNKLITCNIDGSNEQIIAEKKDGKVYRVWGSVPSWSPDGKTLTVVIVETILRNGESKVKRPYLVKVNLENGNETPIKSPDWENVLYAQWTSNGKTLVVLAQAKPENYYQLYSLSYPKGETTLLTNDNENYKEFALATNDDFIIVTEERNPYNLQLIPTDNPLQIRSLTDSTRSQYGYKGLDWTPDGKFIVYSKIIGKSSGEIWKINIETSEQTRLTFDKGSLNKDVFVSPNGTDIYYVSNRSGENQIWRMNIDGSMQKQITNITGGANNPKISPDGNWFIYSAPAYKPDALWKEPIKGGEKIKLLTNAGGEYHISPDMAQIVASYYDPDEKEKDPWKYIFIPFKNRGKPSVIKSIPSSLHLNWSLDNKGLYLLTNGQSHTNINYYSLATESIIPITNYESQTIYKIKISPDGKTIAAARGKRSSNIIKIEGY